MRYIGNKTKLRAFIRRVLRERGIAPGRAMDPFTGTASVATALKRWRFSVVAGDVMSYAYVFARAYVETAAQPALNRQLQKELQQLPDAHGFLTEHFSPAGKAGRMYFTPENARRIDAIRAWLAARREAGALDDDLYYGLLAALIEAADRVANTTGVYAAYVKSWQPNAVRPIDVRLQRIVRGNSSHAVQGDAARLVAESDPFDLLYLDPPYNTRQYPGYYHVPELIATGWFEQPPVLRGKTGLLHDAEKRSVWCSRHKAEHALEALLASARCKHIVMSYNTEGIIPEASIERLLKTYGRRESYQRYYSTYKRYRSDADGENRNYKADRVREHLYCVSR